jgi:hypothetical protein
MINPYLVAGESGKYTYVSKWNDVDIMFHVAPLMPSQSNDKQQVLRKKHIGNGKKKKKKAKKYPDSDYH